MMRMENSIEQSIMNLELKLIKLFVAIVVLFGAFSASAQVAPEKYWIQFTDKANTPFSVDTPLAYLSQRAIDRRVAQNIPIIIQDLPVNPNYITGIQQAANVTVLISSKWLNGIAIQTTDTFGLTQILALPYVDSANSKKVVLTGESFSDKMEVSGKIYENESSFDEVGEGLNYGLATGQNKMLSIDYIHDLGYTGDGMVIAVLDAGFRGLDTSFILQNLFTNNQILGTWDFVLNQPVDYSNHSSHGTFVMNCMGANLPGKYVGTAPDAQYWLLRTEDAPTEYVIEEYNWVAGAEFADSAGADVFNTSLGYTTFSDSTMDHSYADMDGNTTVITRGADIAASKGILVVNSAGNSGAGEWYYIGAPADGDSVLAIGAVRSDSSVANFSSRGPSVDGRVKPNVMAMGQDVPMPWNPDSTIWINGTSFSGPILAGAAACFWQSRSMGSNMDVFHAIEQSAHFASNPNDSMGFGIPNFKFAYFLITGIEDVKSKGFSVQAYPNPTTGYVYLPFVERGEVFITDIAGRTFVQNQNAQIMDGTLAVDLSSFKTGIYFIQLVSTSGSQIFRVMKE